MSKFLLFARIVSGEILSFKFKWWDQSRKNVWGNEDTIGLSVLFFNWGLEKMMVFLINFKSDGIFTVLRNEHFRLKKCPYIFALVSHFINTPCLLSVPCRYYLPKNNHCYTYFNESQSSAQRPSFQSVTGLKIYNKNNLKKKPETSHPFYSHA